MQIQKYHIPFGPLQSLMMPKHAQLLNVVVLDGKLWLYAIYPDNDVLVMRNFRLMALGERVEQNYAHVQTVSCQGTVMHIFEAL